MEAKEVKNKFLTSLMEAVSSQGDARINHVVALVMLSCYCLIEIKSYLLSAFKTRRLLFIIFFAQH